MLLLTTTLGRQGRFFPFLPRCNPGGSGPCPGPAAAAGVHHAPGRSGKAGQDCERAAAKRWLTRVGATLAPFQPVYLGDDLYACQPIAEAIQASGGAFILTCKPSSHKTVTEYLEGAELTEHRQVVHRSGKKSTFIYRRLTQVPLRDTKDALIVNGFSVEILNAKGRRTYHNSFVTDLPVTAETVADLAACGRAR